MSFFWTFYKWVHTVYILLCLWNLCCCIYQRFIWTLIDIWVAPTLWLLWIKLLWHFCVCLLVCIGGLNTSGLKLHFYLVCIGEKKWLICLYRLAHAAKYFSKMVVPVYTFTSSILLHMKKVLWNIWTRGQQAQLKAREL